jgi:hypothetical protein
MWVIQEVVVTVRLLWLELNKLFQKSLRVGARLFLVLSVLSASLGIMVVLAASPDSPTGQRIVHLQLFGGVVHLHDGESTDHRHAHLSKNKDAALATLEAPVVINMQTVGDTSDNMGIATDTLRLAAPRAGETPLFELPNFRHYLYRSLPTNLSPPPSPDLGVPFPPPRLTIAD